MMERTVVESWNVWSCEGGKRTSTVLEPVLEVEAVASFEHPTGLEYQKLVS
jgi:hypothetical protein